MDDCETFDGSMDGGCTKPAAGWPVGLTITKAQGQALKARIAEAPRISLDIDARKSTSPLPFDFMSGTSMVSCLVKGLCQTLCQTLFIRLRHVACSQCWLAGVSSSASSTLSFAAR
jgi:hypothetical protein